MNRRQTYDPDIDSDLPKAEEAMKSLGSDEGPSVGSAAKTVTRRQVDQAVAQLRERRNLPAAEQMRAVLRALDLVVVPDPGEAPGPDGGRR